jgi:hypothetical protein
MVIRTRVTLGTRETPQFVREDFYESVKTMTAMYSHNEPVVMPDTIRYYVPRHFIIGAEDMAYNSYMIDVDDEQMIPRCKVTRILSRLKFKHKRPQEAFDRFTTITENFAKRYFLVLPNARYHHTIVYRNWVYFVLLLDGHIWEIHFRQVHTDPHDLNHNLWFFSKPKYQIEMQTNQDFRNKDAELKRAILLMIPRAFRWELT